MNTPPITRRDGPPGVPDQHPADPPAITPAAERATAYQRLQDFVAGFGNPHCRDTDSPWLHDYNRCVEPVSDARLFVAQPAHPVARSEAAPGAAQTITTPAVDSADVSQGRLSDCGLMASLAALAQTERGRQLIAGMVVENTDARGNTQSYTVTLHERQNHWLGLGAPTFHEVRVTVDGRFTSGHALARPGPDASNEVWHVVIEHAVATQLGGYRAFQNGVRASDMLELLTGRPAQRMNIGRSPFSDRYTPLQLSQDVRAGRIVVLTTKSGLPRSSPVVDGHAYVVVSLEDRAGRPVVRLHNPWNIQLGNKRGEPDPTVPLDELATWFSTANTTSL